MKISIIRKRAGTVWLAGVNSLFNNVLTTENPKEARNFYSNSGKRAAKLAQELFPKARIATEDEKHAPRGRQVAAKLRMGKRGQPSKRAKGRGPGRPRKVAIAAETPATA